MKKTIVLFLLIAFFSSCYKKEQVINYIVLSGRMENPYFDSLTFKNSNDSIVKMIAVKENGTFSDTLDFTPGYYFINYGNQSFKIYLKPGYNLSIYSNSKNLLESINYEGTGSIENNYLIKIEILKSNIENLTSNEYLASLGESKFLSLVDSLYQLKLKLLNSYNLTDTTFKFIEQNSFKIDKSYMVATYEGNKQFFSGNYEFKVSENYPNPYDGIDFNDSRLLIIPSFISLTNRQLREKMIEHTKGSDTLDNEIVYIQLIKSSFENKLVREMFAFDNAENILSRTTRLDDAYKLIIELIENKIYSQEISRLYYKIKKVSKGMPSPTFALYDIHGNLITLNDFKGRYIYIEIWGTWCTICIKEMPAFIELVKKFRDKNIAFVGICIDSNKDQWKKIISDKGLTGYQLYAPDRNGDFFKDFMIYGAPRYILIDKEGNIIDNNAKGPSDTELDRFISNL